MPENDPAFLFQRSRQEQRKVIAAAERGACPAVVAAHAELALRYKVRALSQTSGAVPCIDAAIRGVQHASGQLK